MGRPEKRWKPMLGTVNKCMNMLSAPGPLSLGSIRQPCSSLKTCCQQHASRQLEFCVKATERNRAFLNFQQLHVDRARVCEAGGCYDARVLTTSWPSRKRLSQNASISHVLRQDTASTHLFTPTTSVPLGYIVIRDARNGSQRFRARLRLRNGTVHNGSALHWMRKTERFTTVPRGNG